jgi:hypothetical protein
MVNLAETGLFAIAAAMSGFVRFDATCGGIVGKELAPDQLDSALVESGRLGRRSAQFGG